jgi:hypothetical protein
LQSSLKYGSACGASRLPAAFSSFQESAIDAFVAATEAAEYSGMTCTAVGGSCGSCGATSDCRIGCPDNVAFRCVNPALGVGSPCKSDFDCQGVIPGSVCVTETTCDASGCVMPCP